MAAKKNDRAREPVSSDSSQGDDYVLTSDAFGTPHTHLEANADGFTLCTADGEHYVFGAWQCDYEDLDYARAFAALGGLSAQVPQPIDA
jgi:hypothetical protein